MVRIPLLSKILVGATGEPKEVVQWKNGVKKLSQTLKGDEAKISVFMQDVLKHPVYKKYVFYPGKKAQKSESDLRAQLSKYKVYIK